MLVHCIHAVKISSYFLFGPLATSLYFLTPCADNQFQRKPFQRGRKIHWGGKIGDFRLKSLSISKTVPDRPMVDPDRDFKIAIFLDIEYPRNDMR